MKVLHYSDRKSEQFLNLYRQSQVLVTTGDLSLFDFGTMDNEINRKPAFGVYGNHDSGNYLESLNIEDLHNRVVDFNGLSWGGFQGCLKYKESQAPMYTEDEAKLFADTFPYVDVLLLHVGPLGMLDDPSDDIHIGSENIRRYVLDKKPKFVFCGHQYSDDFIEIGETKVFRTFGARIIEI